MPNITLSRKQQLAFNVLSDPYVVDLLFGGGAGGGKSLLVTMWMAIECRKYPGITIGLGRKEMSNLGKTTVATLLTEAHKYLGVTPDDFTVEAERFSGALVPPKPVAHVVVGDYAFGIVGMPVLRLGFQLSSIVDQVVSQVACEFDM